jgi:hypothetical protein
MGSSSGNWVIRMNVKVFFLLFLYAPAVSAGVVIGQVLYDPVGTESGGEAVELRNTGSSAVDISGWVLSTESSAADATIPAGAVLQPGQSFLVADEGWDASKDDSDWKSADYEEKITLGNVDSGIALLSNGSVVDAVGWGDESNIEDNLYEGSPAEMVPAGRALLRIQDSDDNSGDFVESAADFQPGIPVPVTANVTISLPAIEISPFLNLAPEGTLSIKNNGLEDIEVKLVFNDFHYKNFTIPGSAVSVDDADFVVKANSEHKSKVSLEIPAGAVPGTYTSTLRVIVS